MQIELWIPDSLASLVIFVNLQIKSPSECIHVPMDTTMMLWVNTIKMFIIAMHVQMDTNVQGQLICYINQWLFAPLALIVLFKILTTVLLEHTKNIKENLL